MITQQQIHNIIVEEANGWQKAYLSQQCGNDVETIKKVEQSMANVLNAIISGINISKELEKDDSWCRRKNNSRSRRFFNSIW